METIILHLKQHYPKIIIILMILIFLFLIINKDTSTNELDELEISEDTTNESTVAVTEKETQVTIYVEITGAVNEPGIYEYENNEDVRLFTLIEDAKGFNNANESCINQVEKISDGQKIKIPSKNEECESIANDNNKPQQSNLVNINSANLNELTTLPGIGESKANAIITYREQNGNFTTIDELTNVKGIGESTIQNLRELITI